MDDKGTASHLDKTLLTSWLLKDKLKGLQISVFQITNSEKEKKPTKLISYHLITERERKAAVCTLLVLNIKVEGK